MSNSGTVPDGRKDRVSSHDASSEGFLLNTASSTDDVHAIGLELQELADRIKSTPDLVEGSRLLSRIRDVGSIDPEAFRSILDPFLQTSTYGCRTLYILCVDWGLTEHYTKDLLDFIKRGKQKSELLSCLVEPVMIATDYLYDHSDPDLLGAIIALYESGDSTKYERGTAKNALWHLFGQSTNGSVLLRRAKARLAQEA
jgi:hypothetical protein